MQRKFITKLFMSGIPDIYELPGSQNLEFALWMSGLSFQWKFWIKLLMSGLSFQDQKIRTWIYHVHFEISVLEENLIIELLVLNQSIRYYKFWSWIIHVRSEFIKSEILKHELSSELWISFLSFQYQTISVLNFLLKKLFAKYYLWKRKIQFM